MTQDDKNDAKAKAAQAVKDAEKKRQQAAKHTAKETDKQRDKLKAKELRDSYVDNIGNKDLVADKSWALSSSLRKGDENNVDELQAIDDSAPLLDGQGDEHLSDNSDGEAKPQTKDVLEQKTGQDHKEGQGVTPENQPSAKQPSVTHGPNPGATPNSVPGGSSFNKSAAHSINPQTAHSVVPPEQGTNTGQRESIRPTSRVEPTHSPQQTPDHGQIIEPPVPSQVTPALATHLTPEPVLPPQLTPSLEPTPGLEPTLTPGAIPNATPGQVPQATPDLVLPPQLTPGLEPTLTPGAIPNATPGQVPQATPDPVLPPQLTPGVIPTPVTAPDAIPQATPGAIPTPVTAPDAIPQATPGAIPTQVTAPDAIPQATPGAIPTPVTAPDAIPQATPGAIPTPVTVPDAIPQATPLIPLTATISLNPVTSDNIVNAAESSTSIEISGSVGGDIKDGDTVSLMINGHGYLANVSAGLFSLAVLGKDLAADNHVQAQITTTRGDGRTASATDSQDYSVDTSVSSPTVSFSGAGADNLYNSAELGSDGTATAIIALPKDAQIGDILRLDGVAQTLTGKEISQGYMTKEVAPSTEVKASITDAAGNHSAEVSAKAPDADLSAQAPQSITFEQTGSDGIYNRAELGPDGTINAVIFLPTDAKAGDTICVNGVNSLLTDDNITHGVFVTTVKPSTEVKASITDAAGNRSAEVNVTAPDADLSVKAPVNILFESAGVDNVYNKAEIGADGTITTAVMLPTDTKAGDTLNINGVAHTLTAQDIGAGFVKQEVAPEIEINASITDAAGNTSVEVKGTAPSVDTTAPTLVFRGSSITRDNILNAQEAGTTIDVDGNIAGDYHAGDTVILTVNGKDFSGIVPDNGHFIIAIPGSDLAADVNHQISGKVTSIDNAGNVGSATATYNYGVDTSTSTPTTDLDAATDSGISDHDNLTNLASPMITGTAEPDAAIKITDELGVIVATGPTNSRGVYHLTTTQLSEGSHTLTVEATDLAGNQASATQVVEIDLTAPVIVKVGLGTEPTHQPTFKGTVSIDTASVDILIKQGGKVIETLHATLDGSGGYSVNSTSLPDGSYSAFIQATDRAGNVTMIGEKGSFDYFEIDTQVPIVTVDNIALTKDNTPNITGTVDDPTAIVRLFVAGVEYTAVNHGDGTWSLAGNSLTHPLPDGMANVIDVRATDVVGNSGYAKGTAGVDTQASITMNPISNENILDITEQQHSLTISGSVTGVEDGQVVTVSIGGQNYDANVQHGVWSTSLTSAQVQTLTGGINDVSASVSDLAGNTAAMQSPLFVADGANQPPSMSFKTPPLPTGGGHIGSHISGDLIVPPMLQQLIPQQGAGGWAISDGHGHAVTSLRGHYGTLTIDPDTGHVEYVYNQAPTMGAKVAGGTHWAGQKINEEHHDLFQVLYHDSHTSNVDVKVNLDVTYIHGHSGQNQMTTELIDMKVSPADTHLPPPPPSEESVDAGYTLADDIEHTVSTTVNVDLADGQPISSQHHDLDSDSTRGQDAPVDHYFQMLGIAQTQSHSEHSVPEEIERLSGGDVLADIDGEHPMQDVIIDDPFGNPLDDEKHQDALTALDDSNTIEHDVPSTIDEDASLHQALNDMHSQI